MPVSVQYDKTSKYIKSITRFPANKEPPVVSGDIEHVVLQDDDPKLQKLEGALGRKRVSAARDDIEEDVVNDYMDAKERYPSFKDLIKINLEDPKKLNQVMKKIAEEVQSFELADGRFVKKVT